MSSVRRFLSNLGPGSSVFLGFAVIGAVVAVISGVGLFAFAIWLVIGGFFGGVAWVANTLSMWRRSLANSVVPQRDPAVEALRERYARGEISQDQFESMLRRLKES